jgi:uncharacterized membrane protein YfcA
MSLALLGSLAVQGHFDRTALIRGISLLPATLVGLGLGNLAASRIAPTPFRVLVSLLLVGAGALLLLR